MASSWKSQKLGVEAELEKLRSELAFTQDNLQRLIKPCVHFLCQVFLTQVELSAVCLLVCNRRTSPLTFREWCEGCILSKIVRSTLWKSMEQHWKQSVDGFYATFNESQRCLSIFKIFDVRPIFLVWWISIENNPAVVSGMVKVS